MQRDVGDVYLGLHQNELPGLIQRSTYRRRSVLHIQRCSQGENVQESVSLAFIVSQLKTWDSHKVILLALFLSFYIFC